MPTTKPHSYWQQRRELIAEQVKTMTVKTFAAAHDCTVLAARNAINKMGLRAQPDTWQQHAQALAVDAQTMTYQQIAAKWGSTRKGMHATLRRLGITAQPATRAHLPQARQPATTRQPQPAKADAPEPRPAPRNPKPLLLATPARTSIASKAPAQIIWPAHVKVQHITLPPPSASTRICTGSVRSTYRTGQGLTGYQAF